MRSVIGSTSSSVGLLERIDTEAQPSDDLRSQVTASSRIAQDRAQGVFPL